MRTGSPTRCNVTTPGSSLLRRSSKIRWGIWGLVKLAARVPGGMYILFGVRVLPPVGVYQPPLAVDFDPPGDGGEE